MYLLKKKTLLAVFIAACIMVVIILPTSAATWNITGSTFTHDPCVIKEGSTWWQFYTGDGIGVKYSSNGTAWNQGISIFSSNLSWWKTYVPNKSDRNIWAPDIFHYNGRYWLYYSVSTFGSNTSCIGLTSCTSITKGDWRDDGLVIRSTSSNNYNCIDPGLIEDTSGNLWMCFGSFWTGIKLVQIDKNTMKPVSGAAIRSIASRPDVSGSPVEASYIVYANGYYYLFVSWDSCCNGVNSTYKIAYGRSTNITGPYLDQSGKDMLQGGGTLLEQSDTRWKGPGGQAVAQNDLGWIMVRHAYDANNNGTATLRINDLYFTNGWPTYTPSAPTVKRGDVNSDGNVDALDFAMIKKHILGSEFLMGNGLKAADVDGSDSVDALDYSLIKKFLLGLISEF